VPKHYVKVYKGMDLKLYAFLTWALDAFQAHCLQTAVTWNPNINKQFLAELIRPTVLLHRCVLLQVVLLVSYLGGINLESNNKMQFSSQDRNLVESEIVTFVNLLRIIIIIIIIYWKTLLLKYRSCLC
jgi:hypothetical protein